MLRQTPTENVHCGPLSSVGRSIEICGEELGCELVTVPRNCLGHTRAERGLPGYRTCSVWTYMMKQQILRLHTEETTHGPGHPEPIYENIPNPLISSLAGSDFQQMEVENHWFVEVKGHPKDHFPLPRCFQGPPHGTQWRPTEQQLRYPLPTWVRSDGSSVYVVVFFVNLQSSTAVAVGDRVKSLLASLFLTSCSGWSLDSSMIKQIQLLGIKPSPSELQPLVCPPGVEVGWCHWLWHPLPR